MATRFRAAFDGGARGNPGPAAWGVAVLGPDGEYAEGVAGFLGDATNNVAEYHGLIEALRLAVSRGADDVELRSDSELIVRQILGRYKVRNAGLLPLYRQARTLISKLGRFRIVHVARNLNRDADRLVNLALDRASSGEPAKRIRDTVSGESAEAGE